MCGVREQKSKPKRSGYRKIYRKQLVKAIIFFAAVIAADGIISYFHNHKQEKVEVYIEDYPQIYAEELRIIFGEDCEIGEKNTVFKEGVDCSCGYTAPALQYDTWEVTYHDWKGETFTQTIDNRKSLESLQYSWLPKHLKQYYEQKYLIDYFDEGTFEELIRRTDCFVFIGVGASGFTMDEKEEYDRVKVGNQEYKEQLLAAYRDRDTMLRLSELNYGEIYEHYPMKVTFDLVIDDLELSGEEKAIREKAVQDRVLEIIQAMQSETGDTCNLEVLVTSANVHEDLYDGAQSWRYCILQGKQFEPEGDQTRNYDFAHAYAYEGIYW